MRVPRPWLLAPVICFGCAAGVQAELPAPAPRAPEPSASASVAPTSSPSVAPSTLSAPSPSTVPNEEPFRPGRDALVYGPLSEASLRPSDLCLKESFEVTITGLPPGVLVTIWIAPASLGGWKVPTPPLPQHMGGRNIGTSRVDDRGTMVGRFENPEIPESPESRKFEGRELWISFRHSDDEIAVTPALARFRCAH